MPTYIVSYDLTATDKDYDKVIQFLKSRSSHWWHYLGNTWVIVTDLTAADLHHRIKQHTDADDKVLIVESAGGGAWSGFPVKASEWLKKNV
jgi:hypothetical protein